MKTPMIFMDKPWVVFFARSFHGVANEKRTIHTKFGSDFDVKLTLCGMFYPSDWHGAPFQAGDNFDSLNFCKKCEKILLKNGFTREMCMR